LSSDIVSSTPDANFARLTGAILIVEWHYATLCRLVTRRRLFHFGRLERGCQGGEG
jgi:hypothetical protein